MRKHWMYLKCIIRHKYFVFVAGRKIGVPLWRLIKHDWTKFLPSEWFPYVECFFGGKDSVDVDKDYGGMASTVPFGLLVQDRFHVARNLHQKRNDHHWQYWCLVEDEGHVVRLEMPEDCIKEMVADWAGAGRAIHGKWDVASWYIENKDKIKIDRFTRERVEKLVSEFSIDKP